MKKIIMPSILIFMGLNLSSTNVHAVTTTDEDVGRYVNKRDVVTPVSAPEPSVNILGTANLYSATNVKKASYNGVGVLSLHLWSGLQGSSNSPMGNYYIVLPEGVTLAGGLGALQGSVDEFLTLHPRVHGTATVSDLGLNANNQHVYQVLSSDDGWIEASSEGQASTPEQNLNFEVKFPSKSSGLAGFTINSASSSDYMNNLLWLGTGDGTIGVDTGDYYPQVASNSVGLFGAVDEYVRAPQGNVPIGNVTYFNPLVEDTYNVINAKTGEKITTVLKTGENETSYSRVGLVDTLANLGVDVDEYDESTLSIDKGTLQDEVVWMSTDAFSNSDTQAGEVYEITVSPWDDFSVRLKTIKQTINYEGVSGAVSPNVQEITFATVFDDTKGEEVATYYRRGSVDVLPDLNPDGSLKDSQGWMSGDETSYNAIPNPKIEGYHWLQSTVLGDGAEETSAQPVMVSDGDSTVTVSYMRDFKVEYHSNGGDGAMDSTPVSEKGSTVIARNAFVREGYRFIGWNTQMDGGGESYSAGEEISGLGGDLTLYAQWEKERDVALGGEGVGGGDLNSSLDIGKEGLKKTGGNRTKVGSRDFSRLPSAGESPSAGNVVMGVLVLLFGVVFLYKNRWGKVNKK